MPAFLLAVGFATGVLVGAVTFACLCAARRADEQAELLERQRTAARLDLVLGRTRSGSSAHVVQFPKPTGGDAS